MEFEEFVRLHKEEYLRMHPGVLGIMIKNWMYSDWMAIYFPDEWHERLVEIKNSLKEMYVNG